MECWVVEGKDLLAMDIQGTSDPYCKFRYEYTHTQNFPNVFFVMNRDL